MPVCGSVLLQRLGPGPWGPPGARLLGGTNGGSSSGFGPRGFGTGSAGAAAQTASGRVPDDCEGLLNTPGREGVLDGGGPEFSCVRDALYLLGIRHLGEALIRRTFQ